MARWFLPLLTAALLLAAEREVRAQDFPPPTPVNPNRYPLPASPAPARPPSGIISNTGLPNFEFSNPPAPQTAPPANARPPVQRYPLNGPSAPAQPPPSRSPPTITAPPFAPQTPVDQPVTPQPVSAAPPTNLFELSQIIAQVGNQYILYGDVAPTVNQILEPYLAKAKSDAEREELEKAREKITRGVLKQAIDNKLLYLEFERQMEQKAGRDKLAEAKASIKKSVQDQFREKLPTTLEKVRTAKPDDIQAMLKEDPILPRLAIMMRDNQVETLGELDLLLRQHDSSLEKQQRAWGEYAIGRQTLGARLKEKHEVTHIEMLDYYEQNIDKYAFPAKARFEILTVKLANFPSPAEAERTIAAMGNEVFFGAPFAAVAKKHSQEPNAQNGGKYDWTTKGSLASEPIDRAIFTLEPGKLSQIIRDDTGLHIVRVIERQDAGHIPFEEAQTGIKEAITNERRQKDLQEYLEELRAKTPVRTIYDEPTDVARKPE